jgi:geranylgeranyl diphosphate synthase, type II
MKSIPDIHFEISRHINFNVAKIQKENPFYNSLNYLLSTGGKRLRPLLFYALCVDLKCNRKELSFVAISLEYLHLASLLQDDLPALDNDDFRRGAPTVHKQFSEHEALLLSDWLVGESFSLVIESGLSPIDCVAVLTNLSKLWKNISEGQELDMRNSADAEQIKRVRYLKTASFFESIASIAVLLSIPSGELSYSIARWGRSLGECFQEVDDLIDEIGEEELMGRPYSSDKKNDKKIKISCSDSLSHCRAMKEVLRAELISLHDKSFPITEAVLEFAFLRLEKINKIEQLI